MHLENPELLKQRLLEKITQADINRQKEMEKLSQKLAKQEEHARRVLERKRQLGSMNVDEELRLSVGGENVPLAKILSKDTVTAEDSNSNLANARGGSGRSLLSDATDATASDSAPSRSNELNPLKAPLLVPIRTSLPIVRD